MNVLVTGGAGFIGSHLVDLLIEEGCKVVVLDSLLTGDIKNVNPKSQFYSVDLGFASNIDFVKRTIEKFEIDTVFHLAALPNVQMSMDKFSTTHANTLTSTVNLLDAIKGTSVSKVIFSSTSAIYGDTNQFPTTENASINCITPYALQKFTCEKYLEIFSKLNNVDVVCLRYFNVYGERMSFNGPYSLVLCRFFKQILEGQKLTITNDGEQKRDFIYVKDVARANLLAAKFVNKNKMEIFNVGYGKNFSINEIAETLGGDKEYIGVRIEPRITLCDNSKIKEALGWEPKVEVLNWIKGQI
jgi:UDP-glucose 4-epimerase